MSWAAAAGLAKVLDVLQSHGIAIQPLVRRIGSLYSGQMDEAVEQHRRVAARKDEAIAVKPMRVGRIIAENSLPQHISGRRRVHRGSRMARICLLHRVDGQHADGVDRQLIDIAPTCHFFCLARPKTVEGESPLAYLFGAGTRPGGPGGSPQSYENVTWTAPNISL